MVKGRLDNDLGQIEVKPEVIASYAGTVAVECFGIVGMSAYNMKDGLFHILKKDSLKYGINVKVDNNEILLTVHCIMAYGVSILTVSENLMEAVRYKVEHFTGLKVRQIDVIVEGIRVID